MSVQLDFRHCRLAEATPFSVYNSAVNIYLCLEHISFLPFGKKKSEFPDGMQVGRKMAETVSLFRNMFFYTCPFSKNFIMIFTRRLDARPKESD